jgi:hypothetical protein
LYGAVPSAYDAGRDGRLDIPQNPAQIDLGWDHVVAHAVRMD